MRRTRILRLPAKVLLAALIFAQAALAFANCSMPARAPAQAIAEAGMPCHEPDGETNLCLAHCLAADQSLDRAALPAIIAAPAASFRIAAPAEPGRLSRAAWLVPRPEPPPRILFQSLLI